MQSTILQNFYDSPQKITDLKWLELELNQIAVDDFDLKYNTKKHCIEHNFQSEQEYQLLHKWSQHVGANLEVHAKRAYIYY